MSVALPPHSAGRYLAQLAIDSRYEPARRVLVTRADLPEQPSYFACLFRHQSTLVSGIISGRNRS
jgi:hypothetical protein